MIGILRGFFIEKRLFKLIVWYIEDLAAIFYILWKILTSIKFHQFKIIRLNISVKIFKNNKLFFFFLIVEQTNFYILNWSILVFSTLTSYTNNWFKKKNWNM